MADEKILLVDDEEEFVSTLAERIETRGAKVVTATSGQEAVDKIKDENFDAIVLDLQMPGMNGIEAMKSILEKKPDMQVILLTGYGTIERGVEAVKQGAMDFLEKPIDIKKLMEKIAEAKSRRMVIVEKNMSDKMKDLLSKRGW
ncbi:MAG: response regulator [candidate division Zixibacteria bacterium]|nr:response regulator [candidate division Zixibacteria bacterium]